MVKNHTEEPAGRSLDRVGQPPAWAPGFLAAALPVAVVLELLALIVAGLVFPLFDLTPIFVLVVVFVSRKWAGVSAKWFTASAVLAGVMVIEWIAWDAWYIYAVLAESVSVYRFDEIVRRFGSPLVVLLAAEMIALLFIFGVASVTSAQGVKKSRSRMAAEAGKESPVA